MDGRSRSVVVAGGGLSGLLAARELSGAGIGVKVFEEHAEIGTPEHCGGLVSMKGLASLGILPSRRIVLNKIERAILHSPGGVSVEFDARRQKVVVVDRVALDRSIAEQAKARGAEIVLSTRVEALREGEDCMVVAGDDFSEKCDLVIDARGCASLLLGRAERAFPAAQYIIHASWFDPHTVELYFDQNLYPGFFLWIIPLEGDRARIGVAGRGIRPFSLLDSFLKGREASVEKKRAGPITLSGALESFVEGRRVLAGDAAGQTKPTTGGGIYTGGVGGILAGQAASRALLNSDPSLLTGYETAWRRIFGQEFDLTLKARRLFERLDNRHLDELFSLVASSGIAVEISMMGDFDLHSISLVKALGMKHVLRMVRVVAGSEFKRMMLPFLRRRARQDSSI